MPVTTMSQPSSLPSPFAKPKEDFDKDIALHAKWKDRSEKTHKQTHIPELTRRSPENIDTVLIGSSMFERFKYIGTATRMGRLPRSFNAGVGGDKIPNVLYRIQLGILEELKKFRPQVWVVSIGTNDLRKNRAFSSEDFEGYKILIQALLRTVVGSRVLSTAISYRQDIRDKIVDESNIGLKRVGEELNTELGVELVRWLDTPKKLDKNRHQVDHVHYSEEGYQIWDEVLFPVVEEMVKLPLVEFAWQEGGKWREKEHSEGWRSR